MIVEVAGGSLRGVRKEDVGIFRGVPYAAPGRRFAAAEPVEPWAGVRDATVFGPPAPQRPGRMAWVPGLEIDHTLGSDDCLYVNVWSPGGQGRGVLVMLHGGAFVFGSGAQRMYDGAVLAREHGLVVVTVNYRFGVTGFWYGDGVPANLGLRDQIAALEWVRDNIEAFGGDPGNVTLAGHSAGGTSVLALLTCAPGLFARAVAMSPVPYGFATPAQARAFTGAVRRALDRHERTAQVGDLLAAEATGVRSRPPIEGILPVAPVIDGGLLTRHPMDAIRSGHAAPVPLLVTTAAEEMNLFAAIDPSVAPYARLRTEMIFERPVAELVRAHAGPARHVRFTHRSPYTRSGVTLGAAHLTDVPFHLGTYRDLPELTGPGAEELGAATTARFAAFCHGAPAATIGDA